MRQHTNLSELTAAVANEYLWVLSDHVNQAIKFNDDGLDLLLKFSGLRADCIENDHC